MRRVAKRCVNGMVCVEEVAKSGKVGRGVTGIDHQCRNPQGRGGCVGGRTDGDETKAGAGWRHTLEGALVFYSVAWLLLLESCPCQTGATLRNIKACLKREAT